MMASDEAIKFLDFKISRSIKVPMTDEWRAMLEALPPIPIKPIVSGILMSEDVPAPKTYRQWSTLGKLYVWCNTSWLMNSVDHAHQKSWPTYEMISGIPVIDMDRSRRQSRG